VLSVGALAGCGGGSRQDVNEPSGTFPVDVTTATFPTAQTLSQRSKLVIDVRNSGHKTIPNIAVTICNNSCAYPAAETGSGASVSAFGTTLDMPGLASSSRPVWIVDRPPGPCKYSCQSGGPGSAVTAYTNTWALGRLAAGQSVRFEWGVTAIKPGQYTIAYQVAAGLNGKAKAMASDGTTPTGTFHVKISSKPAQAYVNDAGQIVTQK
jgi:hypothetical protein